MFGAYSRGGYLSLWILSFGLAERQKSGGLAGRRNQILLVRSGACKNTLQNAAVTARDQPSEGVRDKRDIIQSSIEGLPRIMAIENTNPEIAPLNQRFQLRHGTRRTL